ncbi:MAG TPA: hypothetical protein VF536_27595 [Roseateles sp.]
MRHGRLADRDLVGDRGATLFHAGLQRQASTPLRDALPRRQAALREAIALEDEAIAIAGAADTRPSIAVRHLRHCRAPQSKGPPGGGP